MKLATRLAFALALLVAAGVAAATHDVRWLAAFTVLGLAVFAAGCATPRVVALRLLPVVLFCAVLALLQSAGVGRVTLVPWKTLAVFLLMGSMARAFPLDALLRSIAPRSRLFPAALFFALVRHFLRILVEEMVRVLRARSLAVPRRLGPGWLSSLAAAVASIFPRTIERAERFYAAQLLRGLAE